MSAPTHYRDGTLRVGPEPPACECGHSKVAHRAVTGFCLGHVVYDNDVERPCPCTDYRAVATLPDPYVITDEHGRRWSICPHCFFGCEHMQHHGAPPVAMAFGEP